MSTAAKSHDPSRLHLSHGPIDLIVEAWGDKLDVARAYQAARTRFAHLLDELVAELSRLRMPANRLDGFRGPVAQRMLAAVKPFDHLFITPMAAVAGAVADEILDCMTAQRGLARAYVNNGGDIAVWVGPGQVLEIGMVTDLARAYHSPAHAGETILKVGHGVGLGGIATSSWRGRSHSLGIADAVCVAAGNAARADAAATLIANAVDVDSGRIERRPACELDPDSDLAARAVTTDVDALTALEIETALASGVECAREMLDAGLIKSAALVLGRRLEIVGEVQFAIAGQSRNAAEKILDYGT